MKIEIINYKNERNDFKSILVVSSTKMQLGFKVISPDLSFISKHFRNSYFLIFLIIIFVFEAGYTNLI